MTDIFKHAEHLPPEYSASDAFDVLHAMLNVHERNHKGYMHDIAVALAKRERQAGIREALVAYAKKSDEDTILTLDSDNEGIEWFVLDLNTGKQEYSGTDIDSLIKYLGLGGEDGGA